MNVLWITNILFPEAEQLLTGLGELKSSGGWMLGAATSLLNNKDVSLSVATVSTRVNSLTRIKGKQITYYVLPMGKGNITINSEYNLYWLQVKHMVNPDVVHIHGTEFSHGYAYMEACGVENVVVSIQGLLSVYSSYYYSGLTKSEIYRNLTLRDLIKGSVISGQKSFVHRSKYELCMIKMAKHVIGRTSWDRSHVWAINPKAIYHFCNETLRSDFYSGETWCYEQCKKHSIFLSQAGYPIKGLHQLLKAMPIVLKHYPDTQIRVAGVDITKTKTLDERIRLSGYGKIIINLIKKNRLEGKLTFIGNINGYQMKKEYLNANLFLCPSSIENSPNSLGEAQILGVPCVASYVGGIMDMMKGNEENLYRFDDIEMLAQKICHVFDTEDKQVDIRQTAIKRHNPDINREVLYEIYQSITKS